MTDTGQSLVSGNSKEDMIKAQIANTNWHWNFQGTETSPSMASAPAHASQVSDDLNPDQKVSADERLRVIVVSWHVDLLIAGRVHLLLDSSSARYLRQLTQPDDRSDVSELENKVVLELMEQKGDTSGEISEPVLYLHKDHDHFRKQACRRDYACSPCMEVLPNLPEMFERLKEMLRTSMEDFVDDSKTPRKPSSLRRPNVQGRISMLLPFNGITEVIV